MTVRDIRIRHALGLLTAVTTTAALSACDGYEVAEGECRDVYGADVCTWAAWSGSTLAEFGVTFPIAAAENVPEAMEMTWPPAPIAILDLPDGVEEYTGFGHFELNWEHHGHPPATFREPHFDFHFYAIPSEALSDIDCHDLTKPDRLPTGYTLPDAPAPDESILTGLCVPSMGMHAMTQEELESTDPFTATMLIGYYSGEVIFIEPMVSRAKLLEQAPFSLEVPPLEGLVEGIRYPTSFRAEFDGERREYRLVFTDFVAT